MDWYFIAAIPLAVAIGAARARVESRVQSRFVEPAQFDRKLERIEQQRCMICGDLITTDNARVLVGHGRSIRVVCSKTTCLLNYAEGKAGSVQQTLPTE